MLVKSGFARETGIAGIEQTGRRILELQGPDAFLKRVVLEMVDLSIHGLLRQERLPANTIVQRQARGDLPGILAIQANVRLMDTQWSGSVLVEVRDVPGQE